MSRPLVTKSPYPRIKSKKKNSLTWFKEEDPAPEVVNPENPEKTEETK